MSSILRLVSGAIGVCLAFTLAACANTSGGGKAASSKDAGTTEQQTVSQPVSQPAEQPTEEAATQQETQPTNNTAATPQQAQSTTATADELRNQLSISEDIRDEFNHGPKPAEYQKYIVMHDTEGSSDASSVIDWWINNGKFVSSHFIVNKDGSIVQCASLDWIAHHAGYGDTGHNEQYGVTDESRDDKRGTSPVGDWAADYGMNSYSVGIEMVHAGATDTDYPEEQLKAVDGLIAYIDAYYGFQSTIIDHKEWRTGNSDCSAAFDAYLQNYRTTRTHDGS